MKYRSALLAAISMVLVAVKSEATIVYTPITLSSIGGVASESSDPFGFPASRAIDGNTSGANPDFNHTNNGSTEWWNVVLPANQTVDGIRIYNRSDCCGDRLNGAVVRAFDDAGMASTVFTSAAISGSPGKIDYVFPSPLSVRALDVTHHNQFLSLGEVQLFTKTNVVVPLGTNLRTVGLPNLELSQSSIWGGNIFPASRAWDGSTTNFTHTADGQTSNQWWKVNLGEAMRLQQVQLFNRGDGCCPERLQDITVEVLDAAGTAVWTSPLLNPGNSLGSPGNILVDIQAANGGNPVIGAQVRVTRTSNLALGGHTGYILALGEVIVTGGSTLDTDGDGMPDAYEIANSLNPNVNDAALDPDSDGLVNLDEYIRLTNPHDSDSDDDGLLDGAETGTGTYVSASDTGTKALDNDSDDDGLLDGMENTSGNFVSTTNTGTNPNKADTDGDGFSDSVENNSGSYLSQANPGTNPNLKDTDGDTFPDGVEGLYAADPNSASSKPFQPGTSALLAFWPFNDPSSPAVANDVVHNFPGTTNGAYSADAGGYTGAAGDYAMQFSAPQIPNQVVTASAAFVNAASVGDSITISYWQKLNVVRNSSSFWLYSPSAGGGQRGMQIHTPWGDGNLYFDHSGCCDGPQRLAGPLPSMDTTEWHHFTLVKSGTTKQVYVDGILSLDGTGAAPLVSDFTTLTIGGGDNFMDGAIDDFAIFAGTLTHQQICRLTAGESPSTVLTPSASGAFEITTTSLLPGGMISLTWNSTPGCTYRVQYSTDLAVWSNLAIGLAASGGLNTTAELTIPAGADRLFLKVTEQ